MAKRILILGAKGNLGSQLEAVYKAAGDCEVIGWDKEEMDITDQGLIAKKVNDLKPEVIFNAAAYNAVDKCETEEGFEIARKINGLTPGYLAQAAIAVGAILVHYSTDYVFDGKKRQGYTEEEKPRPLSKYGESKLLGEQEIIRHSGKGLKWYLIRTQKLFGPKGPGDSAKPSFFDLMLKLSKEKESLDVVNEEKSCFTYTSDLAAASKRLIDGKRGFGIYHLVNPGAATWYQAAKELMKIAGVKIKLVAVPSSRFPRPAKRPKFSVLLNTKTEPLRPWQEALREYLMNRESGIEN